MAVLSILLSIGLMVSTFANASPVEKRAVIAHDAVVGFPETVPSTTAGKLYLAYKPHLKVVNGCVPFPAVDASGNTGFVSISIPFPISILIRRPFTAPAGS